MGQARLPPTHAVLERIYQYNMFCGFTVSKNNRILHTKMKNSSSNIIPHGVHHPRIICKLCQELAGIQECVGQLPWKHTQRGR